MKWCGGHQCCKAESGGSDDQEEELEGPQSDGGLIQRAMYYRIGRVDKFKHGSTILFLSMSLCMSGLIVGLVQYFGSTPICTIDIPLQQLPEQTQMVLFSPNSGNEWRCQQDGGYDLLFQLNLLNQTMANTTFVEVLQAAKIYVKDRSEKKTRDPIYSSLGRSDCNIVRNALISTQCYAQEKGGKDKGHTDIFGIYFVISAGFLLFFLLFGIVFKFTNILWGGKREGTATI